jgi:formamidopyrimidine-DNA glycosylase
LPELPEVETVVRSVAPHVVGKLIENARFSSDRVTRADHSATAHNLMGSVVRDVRRRGKQIFFELDHGTLYVHLGMTGKLLWNAEPGKYTRAVLEFEDGKLLYDDVRMFGRVEFYAGIPPMLDRVGPDALKITFEEFYARLKRHRAKIKHLLLNQRLLSGIGNIYADEALFAAGIHPKTPTLRISKARAATLYGQIIAILKAAIDHRGSSISDYVDGTGAPGAYQQLHAVYGRAGKACLRCGSPIRRIVVAQRGTHYCPRCQRA